MLGELDYTAIPSESGVDALRLIGSKLDIELVLADFAMSETNGVDLVRAISNAQHAVPVILVAGDDELDALKDVGKGRRSHIRRASW
jgi:CheY-like chemotaxis protein